jgi:heptosyltransferase-2
MATPALRALRRSLPQAEIVAAVRDYAAPLLAGSPLVNDLLILGDREERLLRGAWSYARRLRARHFDAAILLTNSLTSAIPAFLARIPARVGYSGEWRTPLLTHRLSPSTIKRQRAPTPMPLYYQRLLDVIGIPAAGPEYEIPVTQAQRDAVERQLSELGWDRSRRLTALNPGAKYGSSKLWNPDRFAAIARHLRDNRGWQVLVLCGPGEESLCRDICAQAGPPILDSSPRPFSLGSLPALMERIDLLVTTDSGPRHLAVAAHKPVVVVMGPTYPQWTAWNLEQTRVIRHDVPCGPCHLRICPLDHLCMELVTAEEVIAAIDSLVSP